MGAAIITVATDLAGTIQFYWLLRKKLGATSFLEPLLKTVLAAGVMGVVVYLLRDLQIFLTIGIGALVYAILVLILRLIDDSEWTLIWRLLRPSHQS